MNKVQDFSDKVKMLGLAHMFNLNQGTDESDEKFKERVAYVNFRYNHVERAISGKVIQND